MFLKYEHIENSWSIEIPEEWKSVECICAVKVDGANFQVWTEDGEIHYGTRNGEIPTSEDWSGCKAAFAREGVDEKVKKLAQILGGDINVYGELAGGTYRHPDVPRDKDAIRIQGRIDYSPQVFWMVFDILKDGVYLDQDELQRVCSEVGLPCQEVIFRGPFEKCLEQSPVFDDHTGVRLFNLPPLPEGVNVAEGFVIKQVAPGERGKRVILKVKNTKFKERIRTTKKKVKESLFTEHETKWISRAMEFMNEARVMSALSKVGVSAAFQELAFEAERDALDELEHESEYARELEQDRRTIDPKELDLDKVKKELHTKTCAIVRPIWLQNCQKHQKA